jgi:phage-related holin
MREKLQKVWDGFPKEVKVLFYMSLAAAIDQLVKELDPSLLTFVPTYLRVSVLNIVIVFLVEMAKRLRELKK